MKLQVKLIKCYFFSERESTIISAFRELAAPICDHSFTCLQTEAVFLPQSQPKLVLIFLIRENTNLFCPSALFCDYFAQVYSSSQSLFKFSKLRTCIDQSTGIRIMVGVPTTRLTTVRPSCWVSVFLSDLKRCSIQEYVLSNEAGGYLRDFLRRAADYAKIKAENLVPLLGIFHNPVGIP